jgi:F-type H+-transporting ATPase subunit delta
MEISTIARPYAKAAFSYALEHGQLSHWSKMLSSLCNLVSNERCQEALKLSSLSKVEKANLLLDIVGDGVDKHGANLIKVMSYHNRLLLIPEVYYQFTRLKCSKEKIRKVTAISAYPLTDSDIEKLLNRLSKKFSSDIEINSEIDPTIIGGLIIESDGFVIDSSIKGRLAKLADTLMK